MQKVIASDKLSKGCRLCQSGKWLCIFLTYRCNAFCHFCPAPYKDDHVYSSFGNQKEEVISYLKKTDFEGISFSGGDPFLVFDRLLEWLIFFKKHLPGYYFWVYTNGLEVTERKMRLLAREGMDEIRFNIAATNYNNGILWRKIRSARKLFPFVTIEIPSIEKDYPLLIKALTGLQKIGIDYLNLHDYILTPTDLVSSNEFADTFLLNKIVRIKYAHSSKKNTKKIIEFTHKKGYTFSVNHCSMQKKEQQMTQRRLNMGRLFYDAEYDIVLPDGIICNYYNIPEILLGKDFSKTLNDPNFRNQISRYIIKPGDQLTNHIAGKKIIKIFYIPQMDIKQGKIFLKAEA